MSYLSDIYGRKLFLVLSLFGSWVGIRLITRKGGNYYDSISIVGPILQALSPNMTLYIITRGLTGLLGGSVTVGQAYLADCIPPEDRSTVLARLTGVAAFAFIFGPIIGGIFGQASYRLP